jgi:NAD(P)-dependent dehydrogenase (short-subunit alcohol dehydrogenase family)
VAGDTVLVTGTSGFVGSAVARALIGSGYHVRALLRKTSKRVNLAGLDVEIVGGDMRDAAAVTRAMAGARYLFHVAADYRLWARNPDEILVNNREGTRLLMQAALAAGVERVVYTSSVATLACAANGGSSSRRHPAAFRVLSIPGSISCMSTMSQAGILPPCGLASPANIIFSEAKMCCSRSPLAKSRSCAGANRPSFACRSRCSIPALSRRKPWRK